MAKLVHEVLELVRKKKTKKEKVEVLKQNESWALKDIIMGCMDPRFTWNLPAGEPPYTPNRPESAPSNLLKEHKKFKYFVKGGPGDKMPSFKRENIFLGMLEGIDPDDARLLIKMINKETPEGLTKPIVNEAFPGLLKD